MFFPAMWEQMPADLRAVAGRVGDVMRDHGVNLTTLLSHFDTVNHLDAEFQVGSPDVSGVVTVPREYSQRLNITRREFPTG